MINVKYTGLIAALGLMSASASATTISYNMTTPTSTTEKTGASTTDPYKLSYTYDKAVDLTVTGYSYKSGTTKKIEQVEVGLWSGLGAENATTPDHAVNNTSGDFDMLLLSFTDIMKLTSVNNAWNNNNQLDSDMSILAYTGTGSFSSSSLLNKTWDSLLTSGWSIAGNYYNVQQGATATVNSANIYSQYWLVGAYNPAFANGVKNDTTEDYFKLGAVTADTKSSSSSSKTSSAASSAKSSSVASSTPASSAKSSLVSSTSSAKSSTPSSLASSTPSSVASSKPSSAASSVVQNSSTASSVSSIWIPSSSTPSQEPPPPVKVPEPSTWFLVLAGLLGLGLSRRTRK